jgi:hypothetical protein
MSLKAELDAFRSEFMTRVSPEIRDAMVRADRHSPVSEAVSRFWSEDHSCFLGGAEMWPSRWLSFSILTASMFV